MENRKEKIVKILKRIGIGVSIAFNIFFIIALIVGAVNPKKNNNVNVNVDNVVEVHRNINNHKNIAFDDDEYEIYFDLTDLTFTYSNFAYLLNNYEIDDSATAYVVYNGVNGDFDDLITNDSLTFDTGDGIIGLNLDSTYRWEYVYQGDLVPFNYGLTLRYPDISDDSFDLIKEAIELDIQANNNNINSNVFNTLGNSVVAFVGSLGVGITGMISVFYANGNLTTIGLLSVIVVAVSLAYFFFRLLIGLIRMRG